MDFVSHSICVSSPVLNGSCKSASPRCDPNRGQRGKRDAAASPRCDPMRGQRGKQKSGVEGELHLGLKCGSLGTSGSLRGTFTPSASKAAGVACGSLSGSSRGTFSPSASEDAGVACGSLATPGFEDVLFECFKGCWSSSSSMSKIRSSARPSPGPLRGDRGAPPSCTVEESGQCVLKQSRGVIWPWCWCCWR